MIFIILSLHLLRVDDVCDANNSDKNSSSVKKISLMNVEPDTNNSALFDFGDGNDTAVGYENKKNIFKGGNGVKKHKGGKRSDEFHLLSTMVPSDPSDLDGSEGEDLIVAEHPLTETHYSAYFINLETGKVHYRSLDGALILVSKLENIEHAQGHQETQDHLTGNHENNQLDRRGGKDTLRGKDGDDTLTLEQGEAHGGKGKDHYIILESRQNRSVDINIYDTKGEESSMTFFPLSNIFFSLIKDQAINDHYDIKIVLYSSEKYEWTLFFLYNRGAIFIYRLA